MAQDSGLVLEAFRGVPSWLGSGSVISGLTPRDAS
jgi:hypothetical protein